MNDDDLTSSVPSISVTRDGEMGNSSREMPKRNKDTSGMGILSRLFLTASFLIATIAVTWAWQLKLEFEKVSASLERYSVRTGDLEDLLSDTDETVNQSAAAMRIQLKRLDTENRKLWDARKVSNRRISELEGQSKTQQADLVNLKKVSSEIEVRQQLLQEEVARFTSLAQDLTNLTESAKRNQSEVERVADGINRIDLEQVKLERRVAENEGWIQSINVSRRQINGKLTQLETEIRAARESDTHSNSD